MTEDLLQRQLSEAMTDRAGRAAPRPARFDDVEGRAVSLRRRRARTRKAAAAAMVSVVVCLMVVVGLRPDDARLTVGPVADVPPTTPMSVPAGLVGDRWAVLAESEPDRSDVAVETVVGVQPSVPGQQGIEVTPYVYVGPHADRALVYGLGGQRWTTTVSWTQLAVDTLATTTVISGSDFDPGRFTEVSMPGADGGVPDPSVDGLRPEEVLAAPDSRAVTMPVEHLGLFDWVILPERCPATARVVPAPGMAPELTADSCSTTAVGGDRDRVITVDLSGAREPDVRTMLAGITLRSSDELALAPGQYPPAPPGAIVEPYRPPAAWGVAPFLTVFLAIGRDDAAWPDQVPADYCSAFRQWKDIQIATLGSFGTPGWIRWAEALDTMAPPEVGDAWSVIVTEQAAGNDTSATEPGLSALDTVVNDGDARCPF